MQERSLVNDDGGSDMDQQATLTRAHQWQQAVHAVENENHEELRDRPPQIASMCGSINRALYGPDLDFATEFGYVMEGKPSTGHMACQSISKPLPTPMAKTHREVREKLDELGYSPVLEEVTIISGNRDDDERWSMCLRLFGDGSYHFEGRAAAPLVEGIERLAKSVDDYLGAGRDPSPDPFVLTVRTRAEHLDASVTTRQLIWRDATDPRALAKDVRALVFGVIGGALAIGMKALLG